MIRIILEEVMVEDFADSQQQIGVYEATIKKIIHILTCATDLGCKPRHTSSLPRKLHLNKVSDVWVFKRGHILEI